MTIKLMKYTRGYFASVAIEYPEDAVEVTGAVLSEDPEGWVTMPVDGAEGEYVETERLATSLTFRIPSGYKILSPIQFRFQFRNDAGESVGDPVDTF